ncbi:uncharacterized protein LOC115221601 [Argonauta hians]
MEFFLKYVFLTVSIGFSCLGFQELTPDEFNRLERFLAESVRCSGAHAASVSLVRNSTVLYRNGYGHGSPPIDETTTFCVGGLTKLFTAVLVSQLLRARNDSIGFDTPIREILGDNFLLADEQRSRHVTLRDILSQRTGISNMEAIPQMNSIKTEHILNRFMFAPEAFYFRSKVHESNPLFYVVEKVIEKLGDGKPYEELLKQHILEPLSMTGTTFLHSLHSGRRNLAMPSMKKKGERYTVPMEAMRGFKLTRAANGICSNARDMASWITLHLTKGVSSETSRAIIDAESFDEIYRFQIDKFDDAFNLVKDTFLRPAVPASFIRDGYSMGFETGTYRGFDLRTHGGSLPGYESMLSILPDKKMGVYLALTGVGGSKATVIKTLFNMFSFDLMLGNHSWVDYTNLCLILDDLVANLERKSYQSRPTFKPRIWMGEDDQAYFRSDIYADTYKNRMFGDVTVSYNETTDKLMLSYGKTGLFQLHRTSTRDMFLMQAVQGLPYYISNADGYHGVLYGYLYFNQTAPKNLAARSSDDTTTTNNNNDKDDDVVRDVYSVTIPDFDPLIHPTFTKSLKPLKLQEKYGQFVNAESSSYSSNPHKTCRLLLLLLLLVLVLNSFAFNLI